MINPCIKDIILSEWLGIDKDKTLGISNHTFIGAALYGGVQLTEVPSQMMEVRSWDDFEQLQFTTAWYGLRMDAMLVHGPGINSGGVDVGIFNISGSYDPVTGDRTITGGAFGFQASNTMHANGDIDHAVGAHIGFGIGGVASVGASAMVDLDDTSRSSFTAGGSFAGGYANVGVDGRGDLIGGFGVGIPAVGLIGSAGNVNLNAGYGWSFADDGISDGGWDFSLSAAGGWEPRIALHGRPIDVQFCVQIDPVCQ